MTARGAALHERRPKQGPGEHDPINWRGLLVEGLIALLGSNGEISTR